MKRRPLFHRECQKNNRSCIWHTHPVFAIVVVQKTAAASACHDLPLIAKIVPSFCEGTQGVAHLWQYHRHRSRLLQVEDGIFCMLNNSNIMEQIHQKVGTIILPFVQSVCVRKKAGSYWSIHTKKQPPSFCCRWYSMVLVLTVVSNSSKLLLLGFFSLKIWVILGCSKNVWVFKNTLTLLWALGLRSGLAL